MRIFSLWNASEFKLLSVLSPPSLLLSQRQNCTSVWQRVCVCDCELQGVPKKLTGNVPLIAVISPKQLASCLCTQSASISDTLAKVSAAQTLCVCGSVCLCVYSYVWCCLSSRCFIMWFSSIAFPLFHPLIVTKCICDQTLRSPDPLFSPSLFNLFPVVLLFLGSEGLFLGFYC